MRKLLLILTLAVALSWGFNIMDYVGPSEDSEDIAYIDMVGPDGAYVLYYVENVPVIMVREGAIVKDKSRIKQVIERYYFDRDFPKEGELDTIIATALEFNESRGSMSETFKTPKPPEEYCLQITGLSFRDCNEDDYIGHPCLMTCGAVQICKFALEGIGKDREFLDGILYLGKDTKKLNRNAEGIIGTAEMLKGKKYSDYNAQLKEELVGMLEMMDEIEDTAKSVERNFLFSDLLPAEGLQSYCAPVNYSMDSAKKLKDLSGTHTNRVSNLLNSERIAEEILERTAEREELSTYLRTESQYSAHLNRIDARYEELYTKSIKIGKYINDSTVRAEVDKLKARKDVARDDIYKGEFSKAELTIKQFDIIAGNIENTIDEYFNKTSTIEMMQALADKKIIVAEWDLEIGSILLEQQLREVKAKKGVLDERIANKVSMHDIDYVILEYGLILDETDEIIQVKREHALENALSKVVGAANTYSNTLASAYASVSGGDYEQRKRVREYVLPVTLMMFDLAAIGAFIATFIYMVGSGKIRLHRVAAVLWSFIFISFFTSIAGGSIATYIIINEKTTKAGFDAFYFDLEDSDSVAVVVDKRNGDVPHECADMLSGIFEGQMNKTVRKYEYGLDACRLTYITGESIAVETMSIAACDEQAEGVPKVIVRRGDSDQTSFSIKYSASALVSGSNEYIRQCQLGVILGGNYF